MDTLTSLYDRLPGPIADALKELPDSLQSSIEEIRIKTGCPVYIYTGGREYQLQLPGCTINREFVNQTYNAILSYSVYAYDEAIAQGFVTLKGGHRVGICGKAVIQNGKPRGITSITSLNIRRASQQIGASDEYYKYLTNVCGGFYNTILVSPPKCGKTTLLRDMIRNLSCHGFKVGVCDERSEIAGSNSEGFSFDLGTRTDVMDSCPKAEAMMMLIRSMSPDIIATDEIGRAEDYHALEQALVCGVGILTTVHGMGYQDLMKTPLSQFLKKGLFQRIFYLSNYPSVGTVARISDSSNITIAQRKEGV